jgi:hypothetical protein
MNNCKKSERDKAESSLSTALLVWIYRLTLRTWTQSDKYAFMRSSSVISSSTRASGLRKATFLTWGLILVFERAGYGALPTFRNSSYGVEDVTATPRPALDIIEKAD